MIGRKNLNLLTAALLIMLGSAMFLTAFAKGFGSTANKSEPRKTKSGLKQPIASKDDDKEKARRIQKSQEGDAQSSRKANSAQREPIEFGSPKETKLTKAGTFDGDLRRLPKVKPVLFESPERKTPGEDEIVESDPVETNAETSLIPNAAPAPIMNFDGLDFANWGAGNPPNTNGDVGPTYFIQSVNSSIGIFRKSDGVRVAAFTLNNFMNQGLFGNLCDTDNSGKPMVIYDSFEDRWIISSTAFTVDGSGNVTSNSYQCFAASKTGDPVSGGWNYYSTVDADYLGDAPKFGVWIDGIYWSANMYGKTAGAAFVKPRVRAMNKFQMYAGAATVQVVTFDAPSGEFMMLPANARLQTGTPPAGTPNLMSVVWQYINAVSVYKFKVDWNRISLSTLTGSFLSLAPTSFPNSQASAQTPGGTIDTHGIHLMMQNQYVNIGGVESLWNVHTVRGNVATQAAVRYYQIDVTGGNVAANTSQASTYSPDTLSRYLPSLAINRAGDIGMVYTVSSSAVNPAIRYAGRLAGDPINTITQSETSLIEGAGYQTASTRWGENSSMTLDPDGCTFWMTSEYFAATGSSWNTRIGSFAFPGCVPVGAGGTLQGTVTSSVTGLPLGGATVSFGSRTATTDASGVYSFTNIPAGTYLQETAFMSGYNSSGVNNLVISDGLTTTQNFVLGMAAGSSCLTDTAQADFQAGIAANVDLTTSPGDVALTKPDVVDQQNTAGTTTGTGFGTPAWTGQTFVAGMTGQLTKAEVQVFCSGCGATGPNLTLSIRATSGGLPTGPDLATETFPSDTSGGTATYTVNFNSPLTVTAGTQYALILRPVSAPAGSGFFWVRSSPSTYAGGQRVLSANSGANWSADSTRDYNFKVFVNNGYTASGTLESAVKDSNPAAAGTTDWQTLSWNAATPAATSLRFQVAASNDVNGPFNFVGPDGTPATFFTTNGASLAQFNGNRYLKYKAFLATSNAAVTPTLNDVTVCFKNPHVWTGAVSTDWNNAANWSAGGVPGASDQAIIPSTGVTNDPTNTTDTTIGSLRLDAGIIDTGGNTLTVSSCAPSAVTGGSTTSYVQGSLTRCVNNTGTFTFPVGTTSGYAPVSLANIVGSGNFNVNSVQGFLSGTAPNNSLSRYWGLTRGAGVTQADLTLSYQDSDVPAGANESLFKFVRRSGTFIAQFTPSSSNTAANSFTLNAVSAFSDWTLGLLAATAANVSVSGKVLTADGRAISNATVVLTDNAGQMRSARTNTFGYYRFDDVQSGRTYFLTASAKGRTFSPKPVSLTDNLTDFDLTADN